MAQTWRDQIDTKQNNIKSARIVNLRHDNDMLNNRDVKDKRE
jgi:hypothetical protein